MVMSMKTARLSVTGFGLALILAGCGSSGSSGTGGSTGNGGSSSSGGTNGSGHGGSSSSGGSTGTGGASHTGGSTGNGGSGNATGGATGTGGSGSGTGGATGTGGAGSGTGGATGAGGSGSGTGGATGTGGSGSGTGGATGNGGSGSGTGGTSSTGAVTVQLGMTEQMIEGFGINDNWNPLTDAQAKAMFDASAGIGMTILRTGMSPTGAFYNSTEASNISTAKSHGATKIIGSVWTAPANCKDNGSITGGGHLLTSCYDSFSTTIASFAKNNGLYAMSIANEPEFASCGTSDPCNGNYDTMVYTATEMVNFLKMAGPKLQAMGVKVIAPETSEWNHLWTNISAGPDPGGHESSDPLGCGCFPDKNTNSCASKCSLGMGYDYGHYLAKDTAAWADFDIIGTHEYDSQVATAWPSDVNGGKPNKEVWQTEMAGVKWWPEQGASSDITDGVAVAEWVHSALVTGNASAWLWWWYQPMSGGTNDNEGIVLQNGTDTKRHYTIGNFSKFVRPGYTRVDVTGNVPSGVELSAYKGTDGTVAIVAINSSTSTVSVPITISGGTAPASLTPYLTDANNSLVAKTAVTVSGGSFTASLGGPSVTTFVGK